MEAERLAKSCLLPPRPRLFAAPMLHATFLILALSLFEFENVLMPPRLSPLGFNMQTQTCSVFRQQGGHDETHPFIVPTVH
ncbi:hypothetical protein T440DRAFT_544038, partial [Plenodomus tracheiphilus IPT5]